MRLTWKDYAMKSSVTDSNASTAKFRVSAVRKMQALVRSLKALVLH